jgi:hypothetical protein
MAETIDGDSIQGVINAVAARRKEDSENAVAGVARIDGGQNGAIAAVGVAMLRAVPTPNVLTLAPKRAPSGLADDLRKLADQVDAGAVTEAAIVFSDDKHYQYIWGASKAQSVLLATLLQARAIRNMET